MKSHNPLTTSIEPNTTAPRFPDGVDPDFELLENYLDGELTPAEVQRVERRLAAEPELAAALGRMNAEYEIRRAVYQSLEPDARAADALASSVGRKFAPASRGSALYGAGSSGRPSRGRVVRLGRLAGALAACVAISFSAGWVGRGYAAAAAGKTPVVTSKPKEEPYVYQVALTDDHGNITAVQQFDKLEDAKAFAADLGRWQAQQVKQTTPIATSAGL